MDDPEVTLQDTILNANWALTGSLVKAKITWTRSFWRAEGGGTFDTPRIEISHVSSGRIQEVGHFYHYLARVRVYKWSKGTDATSITTAKDAKWDMMEEIKRIIDLYEKDGSETLPSGWHDLLIMSHTSIDVEEVTPPLLGEEFIIRIKIWWKPT